MSYSSIGSGNLGIALARQFGCSGIAVGIANTRGSESIETMAEQLAAQIAAMIRQGALSKDILLVAVPLRAHTANGGELSDSVGTIASDAMNTDDISPDELMGLLNAAR